MPAVHFVFGARAAILMFHEIREDLSSELLTGTTTTLLRYSITWFKENGWTIASLDELLNHLTWRESPGRVVAFTFDDGYRDLVKMALPILDSNHVPFTVFVPTGAPTRSLYSWWLGLRILISSHETITIDAMDRRFQCQNLQEKTTALREIVRWVNEDFRRKSALKATFVAARVSFAAVNDAYFMSETELCDLANHPLATIGAHTSSHAALAMLNAQEASEEMTENRAYLEELLQRPIKHIAFPYGTNLACGLREARLAAELGFSSGVTSQQGQLLAGRHYDHYFLPRIAVDTKKAFQIQLSGFQRALRLIRFHDDEHFGARAGNAIL